MIRVMIALRDPPDGKRGGPAGGARRPHGLHSRNRRVSGRGVLASRRNATAALPRTCCGPARNSESCARAVPVSPCISVYLRVYLRFAARTRARTRAHSALFHPLKNLKIFRPPFLSRCLWPQSSKFSAKPLALLTYADDTGSTRRCKQPPPTPLSRQAGHPPCFPRDFAG